MITLTKRRKVLLLFGGALLLLLTAALVTFWLLHNGKSSTTKKVPQESSQSTPATKTPPTANNKQNDATKKDEAAKQTSPAPGQSKAKTGGGGGSSSSAGSSGGSSGGSSSGGSGGSGSTGACPLPAYPDASCTSVPASVTSLTVVNANVSINTAGTVIDGQDIRGCVEVHAPGVVIRNSKIACSNFGVILSHTDYSGTGLLVEDSDISCNGTRGTGVGDYNVTVRRVNIHDCENGFDLDGQILIEDSYVHNLIPYNPATDPHVDGAQSTPVGNTITLRHNTIDANDDGNSAIISPKVSSGVVHNILIQDNLLFGGGYTLYCQQDGPGDNYRVINNHFSTKYYSTVGAFAPWTDCADEAQVTGNVYHESGLPVPL